MKKIVLVLILFLFPAAGWADEYVLEKGKGADELKLVKGKGVEVCEAYHKELQGMSLQDMVCGEKADTKDFKRPKWERLDLRENKELLKKIHKFVRVGDQFGKLKIMDDEKEFEKVLNENLILASLYLSEVDIDNDAKGEKILFYSDGICMESRLYARPLLVLDEAKNQIDIEKTEPLLQNTTNVDADIFIKSHGNYMLYNVFFNKKVAYFDKWNTDDWTLTVYNQSKGKVKEVCKYKYEQNLKKQGGKQP